MKTFKSSIAAWSAVAHGALFVLLFFLVPDEPFKYVGYALVLGAGFAALTRWYKDAFFAFRSGRGGASFLIVGTFSLILIVFLHRVVVVGSATWPAFWIFDNDVLIRAIVWYLGWALLLLFFAPDINEGVVPPKSFYILALGIAIGSFMMGFSLAAGLTNKGAATSAEDSDLPGCSDARSVWGSTNKVYHLPDSPYRGMLRPPFRCFKDEEEAKQKGYRPAQ